MILLPVLILLLPLVLGLRLAAGCLLQEFGKVSQERRVVMWCRTMALLLCAACLLLACLNPAGEIVYGQYSWLRAGELDIGLVLYGSGMHAWLALLFSVLLLVSFHFSAAYLHREAGFYRFHAVLCLFQFAMLLLVLSASAVFTFVAWEIAGICSWLLIAFNFSKNQVAANANRVMVIQRCGDALFLLGIALLLLWTGTDLWPAIPAALAGLTELQQTILACSFIGAAAVKSAQFPFTPWLYRAMEGPTPSSAVFYGGVMVHAGVYLLILLQDLLASSGFAMMLILVLGILTVLFGTLTGKTNTDIKASMASATVVQLGLMVTVCGLGWWTLATWHLVAHAVLRTYIFLRTPSILHNAHTLPVQAKSAPSRWLQLAAMQQFWLDAILDKSITRPVKTLATDIRYFEDHVLDPFMGVPAPLVGRISHMAQERERSIGARLEEEADSFAAGSGLAGKLTTLIAGLSHWFEDRFILQGVGRDMISLGRRLGQAANSFELLLLRPRYLVIFVLVTVLVVM